MGDVQEMYFASVELMDNYDKQCDPNINRKNQIEIYPRQTPFKPVIITMLCNG